jgi:hypothetical protein
LPEPDSTVSGQEFSQALDRWLDELAATFAP